MRPAPSTVAAERAQVHDEGNAMSTTVLLELTIAPEATDVEPVLRETLAQTAAFPGNEGLEVIIDDAAPQQYVVVEKWASTSDHDAYLAWRSTPAGASRLGTVLGGPLVTRTFERSIIL